MLQQAVRTAVPIESFTRVPTVQPAAVPEPVVGRRWGKPSQFTSPPGGGRRSSDPEPFKKTPDFEVVDFEGKSDDYVVDNIENDAVLGHQVRRTNRLTYTGSRPFYRARPDGTIYRDGNLNIKLIFNLKLHENE